MVRKVRRKMFKDTLQALKTDPSFQLSLKLVSFAVNKLAEGMDGSEVVDELVNNSEKVQAQMNLSMAKIVGKYGENKSLKLSKTEAEEIVGQAYEVLKGMRN